MIVFSDREIVDHTIFLMMAAHDTVTSALSTVVWALATNSDWQEKIREECEPFAPYGPTSTGLQRLPQTEWVFNEALRLYSPLRVLPRRSLRSFEFAGFTIPENTIISLGLDFTHHMPALHSSSRDTTTTHRP